MMFKSRDFSYEVIQKLDRDGDIRYWQCRCLEDQTCYFLVQLDTGIGQIAIPRIAELNDNPAFTDLKEYFIDEESMVLVFSYPRGMHLQSWLTNEDPPDLMKRYEVGRQIFERLILLQLPLWLAGEVLDAARLYPQQEPVGMVYFLDTITSAEPDYYGLVQDKAATLLQMLFAAELESGLYPEFAALCGKLADHAFAGPELMEIYRPYLELLPVCSQERTAAGDDKEPLKERLKRWGIRGLTIAKILMGVAVLAAVVIMIPAWWQEQVVPVWNAGRQWKAVYVDGETLTPETEPETTTAAADPDNGFVTRYWDNGTVYYRGNVADGYYEGKGTTFYKNGVIEYQGEFSFGKRDGEGSLYTEEGVLLYEGGFKKDRYEGDGRLYAAANGNLIYEGEFSGGKYDGVGILYDALSEFPLYDGTFRRGFYDGSGVEYDSCGARLYEGDFLLGVYHGAGIYYEAATGLTMLEGEFRNGMFIFPADELYEDDWYEDASPSDATMRGADEDERDSTSLVAPEAG